MKKHDTGGPAFPTVLIGKPEGGMTLRDYFAAQVLNGILAKGIGTLSKSELAHWAYTYADAMLEARNGS